MVGARATATTASGNSEVRDGTTVLVRAAAGWSTTATTGAAGGTAANSIGQIRQAGGKGGNAHSNGRGGGGGGAAGPDGAGGNASNWRPGTGTAGGGNGGEGGQSKGAGQVGSAPGGGGGGRGTSGSLTAAGGHGSVILTWQVKAAEAAPPPPPADTEPEPDPNPVPAPSPALTVGPRADVTCTGVQAPAGSDLHALIAQHPERTTFCIGAGVHRLTTPLRPKTGQRFIGAPGAVLSGAKVATAAQNGAHWVISHKTLSTWAHGECQPGYSGCRHPDQVFIGGQRLWQVTSLSELAPGRFYFDYPADRIYLVDNPTGKQLEVSLAHGAFRGNHAGSVQPVSDGVHIENLIIERFANYAQEGAVDSFQAKNWTVLNNEIRLNHGVGLKIGTGGVARANHIHGSGQLGVGSADSLGALVERNLVERNNTAGFSTGWEAGGMKFARTDGLVVRGNIVDANTGPGMWTDIDNIRTLYEGNTVTNNTGAGIWHEISYDAVIRNNHIAHNAKTWGHWAYEAGIQIAQSQNVEIYGNTVEDNWNDVTVIQQLRGTGKYGVWQARNVHVYDNVIKTRQNHPAGHGSRGGFTGAVQDIVMGDTTYFATANVRFNGNHYVAGDNPKPFEWLNARRTPTEWRSYGHDLLGKFQ
ncbi:MAG TPA: right-handed parallel beta-helix repeat-containing protein [Egibacteraceae bacterium]|nr:right-handed parallel beta-helix repeat-containing protein [Egibacteraceae bacterium]